MRNKESNLIESKNLFLMSLKLNKDKFQIKYISHYKEILKYFEVA